MAILKYFLNLYRDRKQITLLSWVYAAVAVIFVFIAGIFALVNQSFGVSMLIIPAISVVALIANVVIWALIKLVLDVASEKTGVNEEKKTEDKKKR
jgi:Na+/melibiose symporter-like transporter